MSLAPALLFPVICDEHLDEFTRSLAADAVARGFEFELAVPAALRVAAAALARSVSDSSVRTSTFTLDALGDTVTAAAARGRCCMLVLRTRDLCATHQQFLRSAARFVQASSGGLVASFVDLGDEEYRSVAGAVNAAVVGANGRVLDTSASIVHLGAPVWAAWAALRMPALSSQRLAYETSDATTLAARLDEEIVGAEPRIDSLALDFLSTPAAERAEIVAHFAQFCDVHASQFAAMRLPRSLWKGVYYKLHAQLFDAGATFGLAHTDDDDERSPLVAIVAAEDGVAPHGDVWLIDHAWTTQPDMARQQLASSAALCSRMLGIFNRARRCAVAELDDDEVRDAVHNMRTVVDSFRTGVPLQQLLDVYEKRNGDLIDALAACEQSDALTRDAAKYALVTAADAGPEAEAVAEAAWCHAQNVDAVLDAMWPHVRFYKIADQSGAKTVFYVQDELGAAIELADTSDEANVRCAPFVCLTLSDQPAFDLLWATRALEYGDRLRREQDFRILDRTPAPLELAAHRYAVLRSPVAAASSAAAKTSQAALEAPFRGAFREQATALDRTSALRHPSVAATAIAVSAAATADHSAATTATVSPTVLKIFSDLVVPRPLCEMLNPAHFCVVETRDEADVLFFSHVDFKDWNSVRPHQLINKFRYEANLTYKHLLSRTLERYWGRAPFAPVTYNSQSQIGEFLGDYLERADRLADNTWMAKPTNSSHSLGHIISRDARQLIRIAETQSVIFQKYLERPLQFRDRKFDLRFIVLVRSAQPLEAFVCTDFLVRVSNSPFELRAFDEYEKHFTVHNYRPGAHLTSIRCTDFVRELEAQYAHTEVGGQPFRWSVMLQRINAALKDMLLAATNQSVPDALEPNPQCRAMYGVDVMLDADGNPVILECNFSPDNTRFMGFDPLFFDAVFSAMFHPRDQLTQVARERVVAL